jgi:hypothetical protein
MKQRIKVNPSLFKRIDKLEEVVEEVLEAELISIANSAVALSPVDTGAYVTSFSFSTGAGRPRGKSSDNRPKRQNPQAMKQEGLLNLVSDINKLDLLNTTSVTLRNGSPHATDVEDGTHWKRTAGYKVFAKIRNIYG